MNTRITARNYYDTNPSTVQRTGDVWSGLPTHGLLPSKSLSGVVITPACDLAQAKVETVTYLPVLSVNDWLATTSFLGDALTVLRRELGLLKIVPPFWFSSTLPTAAMVQTLSEDVEHVAPNDARGKEAQVRCRGGVRLLASVVRGSSEEATANVRSLLGPKDWGLLARQLVTNYRKDLHFLPADGLDPEWSIIPNHSVVLFRYPLTAPLAIFDAAQDVTLNDWPSWIHEVESQIPLANAFRARRPLKGLTVRKDFLSDLLTRYAALYLRIGSPDFTSDTVDDYITQLERQ
jgi:hypothetical protein